MYKLGFLDANSEDKITFAPWIRAAERNFTYVIENPEVILFVQMRDNVQWVYSLLYIPYFIYFMSSIPSYSYVAEQPYVK